MDEDILRGSERNKYLIYDFLATEFGWDKIQVDKLPYSYIVKLLKVHSEEARKKERQMNQRQMKKTFK